jgi:zinc protease
VTLEDARRCHAELVGASGAEFAAVGDFDPAALVALVEELFGGWKNPAPYARIPARYFERPALERELRTPDKANAVLRAGLNLKLRDDHPDFPALVLGNHLLGGSSSARLPGRIREKEGLSYSTYSWFSASPQDESANFSVSAIFAPQNKARVEQAVREELARALRDGFTEDEVRGAKRGLLEARRLARTRDESLNARLATYLHLGRTFAWDVALERRIAALTPGEVRDALRRHLDPAKLAVAKAGDFK